MRKLGGHRPYSAIGCWCRRQDIFPPRTEDTLPSHTSQPSFDLALIFHILPHISSQILLVHLRSVWIDYRCGKFCMASMILPIFLQGIILGLCFNLKIGALLAIHHFSCIESQLVFRMLSPAWGGAIRFPGVCVPDTIFHILSSNRARPKAFRILDMVLLEASRASKGWQIWDT